MCAMQSQPPAYYGSGAVPSAPVRTGRRVFRGIYSDYEYDETPSASSSYGASVGQSASSVVYSSSGTIAIRNLLNDAANARTQGDNNNITFKYIPRSLKVLDRIMILAGAPGSGKGTQGRLLVERSGIIVHFSTGDYFRDHVARGTEMGKIAQRYFDAGEFLPDEITMNVISDFVRNQNGKVVLVDGAPRTPGQVALMNERFNVVKVIYLHVPKDESIRRLTKRVTNPETGETFAEDDETIPDEVKQYLVRREQDPDSEITELRYASFKRHIGNILNNYRGKIVTADAVGMKEDVADNVQAAYDRIPKEENIFCKCKIRIADQFALPCGHCTQCSVCAVSPGEDCPSCGDTIDEYITLERYMHRKRADNDMKDGEEIDDIILRSELVSQIDKDKAQVCVTIEVPESSRRLGHHIVNVVDISGSMGTTMAQQEDEHGNFVDLPYNLLGAVKFGLKAQVKCLTSQDYFTLITFDTSTEILLEHLQMTDANIEVAIRKIDNMGHRGSTNLWGGLQKGLEVAKKHGGKVSIALLTDGVPDAGCEGVKQFKEWREENKFPYELVTFGYGTAIKSDILHELADLGNGNYVSIPSSSETGSIFVKFVANACSICTQTAKLQLTVQNGAEFIAKVAEDIKGLNPYITRKKGRNTYLIDFGTLRFGQTLEVVMSLKTPHNFFKPKVNGHETVLPYMKAILSGEDIELASIECNSLKESTDAKGAAARLNMVHQLRQCVMDVNNRVHHIEQAIAYLEKSMNDHPSILFFLKDLRGEEIEIETKPGSNLMSKLKGVVGMETDSKVEVRREGGKILKGAQFGKWEKWGETLIRSYLTTHCKKICPNMYEVGCIPYITQMNAALTIMGKEFYDQFAPVSSIQAPPQPCNTVTYHTVAPVVSTPAVPGGIPQKRAVSPPRAPVVHSSGYGGGRSGSCIAGNCLSYVMVEGMKVEKRIEDLRVGDMVESLDGKYAEIKYIFEKHAKTALYDLECGLRITERHPYREAGSKIWKRAEKEFEKTTSAEEIVYYFMLKNAAIMVVNNIETLCAGHDLEDEEVWHPLYASSEKMDKAVSSLKRSENGSFVTNGAMRDANGRVCGFTQSDDCF